MRIVLTMVAIALGIAIAIVAGVYGWQQYESATSVAVVSTTSPMSGAPASPAVAAPATSVDKPKPVTVNAPKPLIESGPASSAPKPAITPGGLPPPGMGAPPTAAQIASATTPPRASPAAPVRAAATPVAPAPSAEDTPIAVPETTNLSTAEKLAQLLPGMSEDDVQAAMGKDGVPTPADQLPAYTPEGWYEVRWPNADGSYVAGLFNDMGQLAHVEPFNLSGAFTWKSSPWYAVPNWLNEKLQTNNMPVRMPGVDVVEAQADAFQFSGVLANADGEILGAISGTYYVNDPNGRYVRAMEGAYQYTLPNGAVDGNTFQFSE